jgi:pimeloyl-ACP methyl ester carboxylesterase
MLAALVLSVVATVAFPAWSNRSSPGDSSDPGAELKRGAFFGAKVAPVSTEARERLKLETGMGIVIDQVIPGSTAEEAGFQSGDVVVALDGTKIPGAGAFVQAIASRKAGASVALAVRRGADLHTKNVKLKPRPLEQSDAYEVIYGAVSSRARRLRTIVTKPKGKGKYPALFVIQGVGAFSIDNPAGALASYRTIADHFTRRGYVTLRVDKPGCGDSEGGPTRDVDFDTELDGYRQALKMLEARTDVEPGSVFIFGHSMGGVMAPLLAAETPVRGIVAYGTITRTWTEYMLENHRRQMELAGAEYSAIDRDVRDAAALLTYLYHEKLSPKVIAERYPHLRERLGQLATDDGYFVDRSLTFFQQLAEKNLGAAWQSVGGHALAVWGKADFVSNEDDHALIARIVNRAHPGHGTFVALEGSDHGFNRAGSQRESFSRGQSGQAGEFNPAIFEACDAWLEKTKGQKGLSH